ncbi:MAG: outer membrane protein transport protein [Labilithrix sp.]|nr:outer membrane protein transport protein [Labilithrix sp.]MBX3224151.1 outer membrane protein transport protein [Labilithrix sp.]
MRPNTLARRLAPLLLGATAFTAATAPCRDAAASGYLTARFGGDQGGPMMANGYALYFNPAALGGTTGTTITGDLSLALRYAHYKRGADALSPTPNNRDRLLADQKYVSANTGNANLLNLLALPFAGVHTDFGTKNLRAGYAVYVPFGGLATWDRDRGIPEAPGSADGPQRWHNISGQILAIYNTFGLAYVFGDSGFSLGASVSPVIHHVATVRARTADDSDEIEFPNGSLKEGRSYLDATGVNLQATAGAYWQSRSGDLRIGASYLSQPGFGETRMSGKLEGRTPAGDVKQDIDFVQSYPDIIRLGVAFTPLQRLEVRMDGEFVRWSTFERQCVVLRNKECNVNPDGSPTGGSANQDIVLNIPRNWNNAFGYRAGVGYAVTEALELGGSLSFTTSAVPKSTIDASTIDSFRLYGNVGGRYNVTKKLALGANYTHIYFLPVNTRGANQFDTLQKPSQSPSSDGKYTSQIGFLNLNVAYTF